MSLIGRSTRLRNPETVTSQGNSPSQQHSAPPLRPYRPGLLDMTVTAQGGARARRCAFSGRQDVRLLPARGSRQPVGQASQRTSQKPSAHGPIPIASERPTGRRRGCADMAQTWSRRSVAGTRSGSLAWLAVFG